MLSMNGVSTFSWFETQPVYLRVKGPRGYRVTYIVWVVMVLIVRRVALPRMWVRSSVELVECQSTTIRASGENYML